MGLDTFVAQQGALRAFEKGEHLFRQGDAHGMVYRLTEGLLKAYYLSPDGKEHIKSFIQPGETIGSLTAMQDNQACTFGLMALVPSKTVVVPFDALQKAGAENLDIAADLIQFLLRYGMKKELREYELLCLSAEQRYRRLLDTAPGLADAVTQNQMAHYLGVTPVGLSRIKKRVKGRV